MAVISGKNGAVLIGASSVLDITGWSWQRTSNNPSWAGSSVPGVKQRVAGVRDGSGSIDGKLDMANRVEDIMAEGDLVTLLLREQSGNEWSVPAVIDSLNEEADIDDGEIISWTAEFSINGDYTKP